MAPVTASQIRLAADIDLIYHCLPLEHYLK